MRTLLQRDWSGRRDLLRGLPAAFVCGVLLPALARDLHYRGGAAEVDVVDVQVGGWWGVGAAVLDTSPNEYRTHCRRAGRIAWPMLCQRSGTRQ